MGHVVSDRFFIGPVWKPTAFITVNARYQRDWRKWEDLARRAPDAGRSDDVHYLNLSVDWQPRPFFMLSTYVRGERRTSSQPLFDYRATMVGVTAKVFY